jgi:hypothetical protein
LLRALILALLAASWSGGCSLPLLSRHEALHRDAVPVAPAISRSGARRDKPEPSIASFSRNRSSGIQLVQDRQPAPDDELPIPRDLGIDVPVESTDIEADGSWRRWAGSTAQNIESDHAYFYGRDSLGKLAIGVGLGAISANTQLDREFREDYQEHFRNDVTDETSVVVKTFGNGYYTLPIMAGAYLAGSLSENVPGAAIAGEWGERSLRTILVGGPPMLGLQLISGGSRPDEIAAGSRWDPFADNNGVSGHAFMGAIPFITAAKMTESVPLKAGLYAASTLTAWSRVNDDDHYVSQAAMGWWLAYLAATAIDQTGSDQQNWSIVPFSTGSGSGLGIEFRR